MASGDAGDLACCDRLSHDLALPVVGPALALLAEDDVHARLASE
jgi:hypothetical protein